MEMFCGYCGYYGEMVFVHSHYQCPRCKNNIAPCCEGENFVEEEEDLDEQNKKSKEAEKELPESDENVKP